MEKWQGGNDFVVAAKKHTFLVVHISFFYLCLFLRIYLVNSWVLCGRRKKYIIRSRLFYDIDLHIGFYICFYLHTSTYAYMHLHTYMNIHYRERGRKERNKERQSEGGRDRMGIIKKIYWLIEFFKKTN